MRFAAAFAAAGGLLTALAAVLLLPLGGAALAQPATTTIAVGDLYFCAPSFQNGVCETTVNEGDTVEWQFSANVQHTTTECSDDHDTCSAPHLWDSPVLSSGGFPFTFDTPGTFLYRCQLHPGQMRGSITVVAVAEPSPTAQASAVPSGGGVPPADGGAALSWGAVAGGAMLIVAAAALAAGGLRRRDD